MKKKYKNQIIIYVIAFMLVTAGYLNYTEKNVIEVSSDDNQNRTDENIGDAKLVNSDNTSNDNNDNQEENKQNQKEINQAKSDENQEKNNKVTNEEKEQQKENDKEETTTNKNEDTNKTQANENTNKSEVTTNNKAESNTKTNSEYFTNSKLERENMYSQMLENYQKMLNNASISEEQKSIASQEIKNINNTKNSIMICENLITTKGFEKVVIFVNGESINVVVKSEKLTQEQVAQIQNIVIREMNSKTENIHIMTH